jgi:hypothetical protein
VSKIIDNARYGLAMLEAAQASLAAARFHLVVAERQFGEAGVTSAVLRINNVLDTITTIQGEQHVPPSSS